MSQQAYGAVGRTGGSVGTVTNSVPSLSAVILNQSGPSVKHEIRRWTSDLGESVLCLHHPQP